MHHLDIMCSQFRLPTASTQSIGEKMEKRILKNLHRVVLKLCLGVYFCADSVNAMFNLEQESAPSWTTGPAGGNYVYASFPVDVIVYVHMQPSTFRFSCLPVSRVECMLQLPSLDIVFSSKRAEEELQK